MKEEKGSLEKGVSYTKPCDDKQLRGEDKGTQIAKGISETVSSDRGKFPVK